MQINISQTKAEMGKRAAEQGAQAMRDALAKTGATTIIIGTGASQFEIHAELIKQPGIRWDKVTIFHLDEYVGMDVTHPASFRRFLWERFVAKLPLPPTFHFVNADTDPHGECKRVGALISQKPVDVAFIGIGENGHIAFNDPPADFNIEDPYLVVNLDEACRKQQLGEGWFPTLNDVPKQAISMSVKQILKSKLLVCTVPDARKAAAVKGSVEGPVTPDMPGSILQKHGNTFLFLDREAASGLKKA